MPAIGLYSVSRLARNLVSRSRLNYYQVAFKSHLGRRRISAVTCQDYSSMVLVTGRIPGSKALPYIQLLLQAEQQKLVVVLQAEQQGSICLAAGRAAGVSQLQLSSEGRLAAGRAAKVDQSAASRAVEVDCSAIVRQQGTGLAARGISQQRSGGSAVLALDGRQQVYRRYQQSIDRRRIGTTVIKIARRHISARGCQVRSQAYRCESLLVGQQNGTIRGVIYQGAKLYLIYSCYCRRSSRSRLAAGRAVSG